MTQTVLGCLYSDHMIPFSGTLGLHAAGPGRQQKTEPQPDRYCAHAAGPAGRAGTEVQRAGCPGRAPPGGELRESGLLFKL